MLTPAQSRAARGLLGWSQSDLAGAARVSLSTVRDFEKSRWTPIGNSLAAMREALEGWLRIHQWQRKRQACGSDPTGTSRTTAHPCLDHSASGGLGQGTNRTTVNGGEPGV